MSPTKNTVEKLIENIVETQTQLRILRAQGLTVMADSLKKDHQRIADYTIDFNHEIMTKAALYIAEGLMRMQACQIVESSVTEAISYSQLLYTAGKLVALLEEQVQMQNEEAEAGL